MRNLFEVYGRDLTNQFQETGYNRQEENTDMHTI